MAERRPKHQALERVLGTGALFSTAYGNVGKLDLLRARARGGAGARHDAGVFLISGLIFACTAATYAEATAMYPRREAHPSFARHAFNEFWSFFRGVGADAQLHHHGCDLGLLRAHYLAVFWGRCTTGRETSSVARW